MAGVEWREESGERRVERKAVGWQRDQSINGGDGEEEEGRWKEKREERDREEDQLSQLSHLWSSGRGRAHLCMELLPQLSRSTGNPPGSHTLPSHWHWALGFGLRGEKRCDVLCQWPRSWGFA
jgi:hypothetical protein